MKVKVAALKEHVQVDEVLVASLDARKTSKYPCQLEEGKFGLLMSYEERKTKKIVQKTVPYSNIKEYELDDESKAKSP